MSGPRAFTRSTPISDWPEPRIENFYPVEAEDKNTDSSSTENTAQFVVNFPRKTKR